MTYDEEQLGFIFRFKDKMRPIDMAYVLGQKTPYWVNKAIMSMRTLKVDKYPMSEQERLANEFLKTRCDSITLAFDYAFDACLDLSGAPTLRVDMK